VYAEKGAEITIKCTIKGTPNPTVNWIKKRKPFLKASKKYVMESTVTTATITIKDLKKDDFTNFILIVENPIGKDTFTVEVIEGRELFQIFFCFKIPP
jgi:hypothetical protein